MRSSRAAAAQRADDFRDDLEFAVATRIVLASRRFQAKFTERIRDVGQTHARWFTLYKLSEAPAGLSQTEVAERVGIQGPSLVKLLDALEGQGLVRRSPASGDRRVKLIVLEPAGRQALAQMDGIAHQLRGEVFAGLSDSQLAATASVLESVVLQLASETPHRPLPTLIG